MCRAGQTVVLRPRGSYGLRADAAPRTVPSRSGARRVGPAAQPAALVSAPTRHAARVRSELMQHIVRRRPPGPEACSGFSIISSVLRVPAAPPGRCFPAAPAEPVRAACRCLRREAPRAAPPAVPLAQGATTSLLGGGVGAKTVNRVRGQYDRLSSTKRRYGVHRPLRTRSRPARSGVATTLRKAEPPSAARNRLCGAVRHLQHQRAAGTQHLPSAAGDLLGHPCPTSAPEGSQSRTSGWSVPSSSGSTYGGLETTRS